MTGTALWVESQDVLYFLTAQPDHSQSQGREEEEEEKVAIS